MTGKMAALLLAVPAVLLLPACIQHNVDIEPVEVKPIHITIDVNVKVDRALDNFFGDLDKAGETATTPAADKK